MNIFGNVVYMWFKVKQETVEKVSEIVKKQLSLTDDQKVTAGTKFTELGADSLDTVNIISLYCISELIGHHHQQILLSFCRLR